MSYEFRPARRENAGLLIGLIGASGSGKTYTAMRLAKGIAGDKPFCVIDTEARRALHYADQFRFDHGELKPPFRPSAYAEAIKAADQAGYPVIVIDSCSHEHAGEGGILDWHDEILDKRAGKEDYAKREAMNMVAWVEPKSDHKKMVQRLLQIRAHLILCFRAEEKIEMVRKDGKLVVQPKQSSTGIHGWIPICEKNLPYELTVSLLLMADKPGVPVPIKLQEQHKTLFPLTEKITEESGARLAAWARGAARPAATAPPSNPAAPATKAHEADSGRSSIGDTEGAQRPAAASVDGRPREDAANEPPKAGDEPARGPAAEDSVASLFAPPEPVKAETAKGPGVPGITHPDERQQLEAAILAEKAKLERQPTAEVWDKICEDVCGTTVLSMADPSALADLLAVVKGLLTKDREAIARVKKIMGSVAA